MDVEYYQNLIFHSTHHKVHDDIHLGHFIQFCNCQIRVAEYSSPVQRSIRDDSNRDWSEAPVRDWLSAARQSTRRLRRGKAAIAATLLSRTSDPSLPRPPPPTPLPLSHNDVSQSNISTSCPLPTSTLCLLQPPTLNAFLYVTRLLFSFLSIPLTTR